MKNFAWLILFFALAACGRDDSSKANSARPQAPPTSVSGTAVSDALKPAATATPTSQSPSGGPAGRRFDRSLTAPTGPDMVFILYDHLGQNPPFEEWANQDYKVQSANEFERDQKRQDRIKELQAQFAAVQGVGTITVTMSSALSPYDATYKEYTLGVFGGGGFLTFQNLGKEVQMTFTNALDAYAWKIEPGEAERVLRKNAQSRSVTIIADLKIESARPTQTGGALQARILRYSIQGTSNQGKFADITLSQP
jgi:hypothetical protein